MSQSKNMKPRGPLHRILVGVTALAVVASMAVGVSLATGVATAATPAATASGPGPVLEPTASMPTTDALPTVQMDGVAWAQVIVGNTVYVGGAFANARPAGAAPGTSLIPRANMLAYTLSTGVLNTSFAPVFNGQVRALAVSPDQSTLYVGGDFTTVNGLIRNRIAAFSTASGALLSSFDPSGFDASVRALAVTNGTVYAGGLFSSANGVSRNHVAAFNAANGALTTWNPNADGLVSALVVTPDGSEVIAGGSFQNMGGSQALGLAAVDATTAVRINWAVANLIQDSGSSAGITSLTTDGTNVIGTGYQWSGGGNFEGMFSATADAGVLNWMEDCHGDSYDAYVTPAVAYVVSHSHDCSTVGSFPQVGDSSATFTYHRSQAFTNYANGTLAHSVGYTDFYGEPSPSAYNWYPDFTTGYATGQNQAAWTITGNSQYLALGGEFPTVNNTAQQGLVRFAVRPLSPSADGGRVTGGKFVPISITSPTTGSVRVEWQANYERDSETLTYKIVRDSNTAKPVFTTTVVSNSWNRPGIGFVDTGLVPGSTHTYRIYMTDPYGVKTTGDTVSYTVPLTASTAAYTRQIGTDGASSDWPLNEASGSVALDNVGYSDADLNTGVTRGATGPISGDTASTFNGTSTGTMATRMLLPAPNVYTTEAWFRTTTTSGGKIIGYGDQLTGLSNNYDRHIYMDNAGHIIAGAFNGNVNTITSTGTYNDGNWHMAAASMGANGLTLYVDGQQIGNLPNVSNLVQYTGYWRVGGDNLNGWTNQPSSHYFAGDIAQVAVFPTQLSSQTIQNEYSLSANPIANKPPTASFTQSTSGATVTVNGSGSSDPDGNVAGYSWNFGDGTAPVSSATPTASHTYTASGNYTVTLTVTDNGGAVNSSTQQVSVIAPNQPPVASFTSTVSPPSVTVNGSGSSDPDGTVAGYSWNFGDGSAAVTGTSPTASHTYSNAGTYGITLTVTDNGGLSTASTQLVTVNQPPVASFTKTVSGMTASVDGSASSDPDGSVAGYSWDFGDGSAAVTGTGPTASHTFTAGGTYTVTLTVTDNNGATNSTSQSVTVNQPPVASFTQTVSGLTASVNGSASSDPDGTVAGYSWNFGDGSAAVTGTSPTASYTYSTGGTYTVTLTVTDNGGATNSTSQQVSATVPNQPPVAAFTSTVSAPTVTVNGSGSFDPDGTVAGYSWNFGDGTAAVSGTSSTASHIYTAGGTYTVTLTVTDNNGATNSSSQSVTVNQPPVASFTTTVSGLTVAANGSASSDPDGAVASYSWNFGDGTAAVTGTSPTASHAYTAGGAYTVTLTVTDNNGATNSTSQPVAVADLPPVASFTSTVAAPKVTLNGAGSSDPDGTIAGYSWNFGDGSAAVTGTSPTASHSYAAGGTYPITLTVTDNDGASTSITQSVTVNQPPVASFATTVSGLAVAANGSASSDPDGTVASYSWNFGDGSAAVTGASPTASHTYAAAGTYTVTLTVTDNTGATKSTTQSVPVSPTTYASDTFSRTVASGLGSATIGGAWTASGSSSLFSVDGSRANLKMSTPGAGPSAYLNGLSVGDADLTVNAQLSAVPNGGGAYVAVAAHHTSSGDYRVKLKVPASGAATLYLTKVVGGTETVLVSKTISGLTLAQTDVVGIEFRVSGSGTGTTTLQANVWKTSAAEPAGWQLSTTDTTAGLQGPGGVGIWTYLSASSTNAPVVAFFDNLLVQSLS